MGKDIFIKASKDTNNNKHFYCPLSEEYFSKQNHEGLGKALNRESYFGSIKCHYKVFNQIPSSNIYQNTTMKINNAE